MVLDAVFLILLVSAAIIALLPVAVCCLFLFRRNGERDFHLEVNCPGTTRLNLRDISDANVDRDVGLPTPWAHEGHFRYTTRQHCEPTEPQCFSTKTAKGREPKGRDGPTPPRRAKQD
ncbi:hypothetical protein BKA70DRAFT_1221001 [Coprinopsis sp. MPI-PUGE-AT-0042]|nr:hypothetical protein BKA70DRAFT_1221001 [Coprinopsis sp. MPI-PUGE-AT-0042]